MESVEKYRLEVREADGGLSLDRDWMKTWPCKFSYSNTGKRKLWSGVSFSCLNFSVSDVDRVLASSVFSKIIVKTSTNKHRLVVVDQDSGDTLYQVPVDMFVDHILIFDGWVVLLNANNLLLSIILDFN